MKKQPRQQGELHMGDDKYFSVFLKAFFEFFSFDDGVNHFPSKKAKTQSGSEIS